MGHSLYPIRILIVNNVYLHLTHVFSFAASFYTPVCNACLLVKAHLLSVCNISLQLNIIMIAVHIQPPPPKRRRPAATIYQIFPANVAVISLPLPSAYL